MPQLNRDKESLYTPGRLSLWFLATSGALFACIVWMLWADYDRPWKKTQKEFYRRQAGLLDVQARIAHDAALSEETDESKKKKEELRRIVARARVRLTPRVPPRTPVRQTICSASAVLTGGVQGPPPYR